MLWQGEKGKLKLRFERYTVLHDQMIEVCTYSIATYDRQLASKSAYIALMYEQHVRVHVQNMCNDPSLRP